MVGLSIFGVTNAKEVDDDGIKNISVTNAKGVKGGWGLHFAT